MTNISAFIDIGRKENGKECNCNSVTIKPHIHVK